MCLKRLFKLVFFGIIAIVLVVMFAPSFIKGAGSALLSSANSSAAQGFSSLVPGLQGKGLSLQINVSGLNPSSDYYVTLDGGGCGGQVLAKVGKITTDASGATTATLSVADLTSIVQNTLYLDIHQGTDANGQSVACGQVQLNDAVASLVGSPTTVNSTSSTSNPNITAGITLGGGFLLNHSPLSGFPNTGVAPARGDGYDNNTFPRKY